ncbi:MAG: VOC family protein [Ardenticatenales bacterium]|nr:VOC family protein [Ardenticatenales bacterium]
MILTLISDDVDGWYDRLRGSGAIVVRAPERNEEFGIYHFFARDPNGYRIEIQRFLSAEAREVCHRKGESG